MPSTPAEVARTLAAGRLPGRLSVPTVPDDLPVAHATAADGGVLVAARRDSRAWLTLLLNGSDEPAILCVDDEPPFPDSPGLGRVHVGGWLTRLETDDLQAAGMAFAEQNPFEDLLDLGRGVDLFRLEPGEICLQRSGEVIRIEPHEFAGARPDPLHADERDLLIDLRDHHAAELALLVPGSPRQVRPLRLDRYGVLVALPMSPDQEVRGVRTLARLEFARPAQGACCVGRALHLDHAGH
jgi:hypothetical protein